CKYICIYLFIYSTVIKSFYFFFFFQAEDGIRDFHVTGVQTCALPIWRRPRLRRRFAQGQRGSRCGGPSPRVCHDPSGAWYFSPGVVRAISTQPCVKAYSCKVARCACARSA